MKKTYKTKRYSTVCAALLAGMLVSSCGTRIKAPGWANLTDYGSSWDLTTAFPGVGKYSGVSSAISASDVCSGKSFLGIPGTADCGGAFAFASMACRADNAAFDPLNPGTRDRATLDDEAAGNLVAEGNALVPDPMYDTDGRFAHDDGLPGAVTTPKRTYLEVVKGRPTVVCGLGGATDARIDDCESRNTVAGVNHAL